MSKPKVVILCGGIGARIREETEFRPKPMVTIGDRPILWHIMKNFAHYGYKDFVLCLGYKGEMIKEYFYNYEVLNNDFTIELGDHKSVEIHSEHPEAGWRVTLADTGPHTLKGARLKRVEGYLGDDDIFLTTYGDGIADVDIDALVAFHRSHGKLATVTGINPASRFGELKITGENTVESFMEKPENTPGLISGGFFVFSRDFLKYLSADEDCDLEFGVLEDLGGKGEFMVYRHEGFWGCMDTYRDMEHLNGLWNTGKAPWKIW